MSTPTEPRPVLDQGMNTPTWSEPMPGSCVNPPTGPKPTADTGMAASGPGGTEASDAAGFGAGRVGCFTVLYDDGCPICRAAHRWLAARAQLVPLDFVPAASPEARRRFPGLDHAATLQDLTVIADSGLVYVSDGAWLACLWALADYRGMAQRLSSPRLLPAARRFIAAASAVRRSTRAGGYGDVCDDRCRPA